MKQYAVEWRYDTVHGKELVTATSTQHAARTVRELIAKRVGSISSFVKITGISILT